MRSVTAVELGSESCVLVKVRAGREPVRVSAVHGLADGDWSPDETLAENLRRTRLERKLPRRAVVVLRNASEVPAAEPVTRAMLAPLTEAGFVVSRVVSAPAALKLLAERRDRPAGRRDAEIWLALNRDGAAIAIVDARGLLFSRAFDWRYRAPSSPKEELLQRYTLAAHLSLEVRHAIDMVRASHGVVPVSITTCGDLPDLRSLTMPLIEELDLEVETLDTADGLEAADPAVAEQLAERATAVRLACAAAAAAPSGVARGHLLVAAAVVLLLLGAAWFATRAFGGRDDESAARAPEPSRTEVAAPAGDVLLPRAARPAGTVGTSEATSVRPPAAPTVERAERVEAPVTPETRPAATSGRADAGAPLPPAAPLQGRAPTAARPPAPLADPLPVVNSILVSPERRLAVADGEIVREGDAVGRRVLVRIEPDALVLREPSGREVRVPIRRRLG